MLAATPSQSEPCRPISSDQERYLAVHVTRASFPPGSGKKYLASIYSVCVVFSQSRWIFIGATAAFFFLRKGLFLLFTLYRWAVSACMWGCLLATAGTTADLRLLGDGNFTDG